MSPLPPSVKSTLEDCDTPESIEEVQKPGEPRKGKGKGKLKFKLKEMMFQVFGDRLEKKKIELESE